MATNDKKQSDLKIRLIIQIVAFILSIVGIYSALKDNFLITLALIPIGIGYLFYNARNNPEFEEFAVRIFHMEQINVSALIIFNFLIIFLTIYFYVSSNSFMIILLYSIFLDMVIFLWGILIGWMLWESYGKSEEIPDFIGEFHKKAHEKKRKEKEIEILIIIFISIIVSATFYLLTPPDNILRNSIVVLVIWLLSAGCAILNYANCYYIEYRRKQRESGRTI